MLRVAYGNDYGRNSAEIKRASLLRAYAKPALAALVLHVIVAKLEALMKLKIDGRFGPADVDALRRGLVLMRDAVASAAPPAHQNLGQFSSDLIKLWSRGMRIFRKGSIPMPGDETYEAVSPLPISQMVADPNVVNSGLGLLAMGLALLGLQLPKGAQVSTHRVAPITKGAFEARGGWAGARPAQIYFAQGPAAVLTLIDQGALDGDNIVVLHSDDSWHRMAVGTGRRSPGGNTPRDNRVRHVSVPRVVAESDDYAALEQRFLEEVTL
jgi:hypothetical protein